MKLALLILLVANLVFLAGSRYFSAAGTAADGVGVRANEPEKLKIVPPAEPSATAGSAPCFEWGPFTSADQARAEKALEPLALGPRLALRRSAEGAPGWWVFIPSQGSRQSALKKAAELKALGVTDYRIMGEEGDAQWSLSLGVYRSEQAALARLAAVRDKGVSTALVGTRETLVPRVWLQVRGVEPALEARLREVARELEASELRACP
jgi:hypothetical protein